MIKFKTRPPTPATLTSEKVIRIKREIETKVENGDPISNNDFKNYWIGKDVRAALWNHQHGKCGYCERFRELTHESDVEHFRPKLGITDEADHLGYWWLAYEWGNYIYTCKPCNQKYKKNHFPLLPDGIRSWNPGDSLEDEKAVFINPYKDEPKDFIGYDWQQSEGLLVKPIGLDDNDRGYKTIKLLGLDRIELNRERARLLSNLEGIVIAMHAGMHIAEPILIERAANLIREETRSEQTFAGFRRAYFRACNLAEYISED